MSDAAAATLNLLQSCTTLRDTHQVHALMLKSQHHLVPSLSSKLIATTSLLPKPSAADPHAHINHAISILSRSPTNPSPLAHNSIIRAYLRSSSPRLAVHFFAYNLLPFVAPNAHTFPPLLKACALLHSPLPIGYALHALLLKLSLAHLLHSHTALLSLYSSSASSHPSLALLLLLTGPHRSCIASWNAAISGFAKSGRSRDALALFRRLLETANGEDSESKTAEPDEITVVSVLAACADLGALDAVKWVHEHATKNGIAITVYLGTGLVDAYAKCGSVELARRVFDEMPERNVSSWTAMIRGLAMFGHGEEALALFKKMVAEGVRPDDVALVGVLSACSHSGLVDEGRCVFDSLAGCFGVSPKMEHYGCMVDLLSRAGLLEEALSLIESMPMKPEAALWGSLLSACRKNPANVELAEHVAGKLMEIEPHNDATYVLLSNIYAYNNRWEDVARVRAWMKARGIKKTPGCSSVEVDGMVHEFIVGDKSHPRSKEIYEMVEEIESKAREMGHVMNTSEVLLDIEEDEKKNALWFHSEKLALAFGLIGTDHFAPIRIVKNIRVCNDCHSVMKLASKAYGREIILRDRNRFHKFNDGFCTCNDFW